MTITKDTAFREIPDVQLASVLPQLRAKGSPMVATAEATHEAARPVTAMWWANTKFENQWGTTGHVLRPEDHNPAALRPWVNDPAGHWVDVISSVTRAKVGTMKASPHASGVIRDSRGAYMLRFASDADCAREYKRRLLDPAYKHGVYTPARTIEEFLHIYTPPGDVHPVTGVDNAEILAKYLDTIVTFLNSVEFEASPPPPAGDGTGGAIPGGTDMATKPKIIQGYTPKIIDKWIHVTQDGYTGVQRFIRNRNGQKIRVLKWHVMEGTMWGSWIHAHAVKASWTVQIGKDGAIWRTVPEQHGPWTNGDVNKPSQQMVSIMNRYGWDPNVYTLSVEHEGKSGGLPYTDAQLKASVWQAWDWITRYGDDLVLLVPLGHYETNGVHRPNCPDPEWQGHPFIAQMKKHLGDRVADHDVIIGDDKLWPVRLDDGTAWDGAHDVIVTSGAQPVKFFADTRTVTVTAAVLNSRQWASTAANLTRHAKENGETIDVLGAVEGEVVSDEGRWWVDALGNRYWSGGTAEKPDMTWNPPEHPGDPEPPDDEPHLPDYGNHVGKVPQVVNGTLYYAFWDDEDPAPGHLKTAIDSGNLRKWAGVGEAVGTVQEGDAVRVTHYVYGEPVEYDGGGMESMWYIVDPGDGRDPILHGARVWAGLFNERPH